MYLCYTVNMESNHQIWRGWAHRLHGWGLTKMVVSILQLSKPFHYLGAHTVYITQPFLSLIMDEYDISNLAALLEDEKLLSIFTKFLEEELV